MAYTEFFRSNAALLATLESSLRSMSYLLPGRFKHSEIVAEGVYGGLNVLDMYHDWILQQDHICRTSVDDRPSIYNQYTRDVLRTSRLYASLAYTVSVVQSLQVLAEMTAKEFGSENLQWKVVGVIEFIKMLCRASMFKLSKRRTLLHSQVFERDIDLNQLSTDSTPQVWNGLRTKKNFARIEAFKEKEKEIRISSNGISKYLVSRAIIDNAKTPSGYLSELKGLRSLGEWVNIIRPFAYWLLLHKYGKKSWKPWVGSLLAELFSLWAVFRHSDQLKMLERSEFNRRIGFLYIYALRQPVYQLYTKEKLTRLSQALSKWPILSLAGTVLSEYMPLWENYHFLSNP
ncbi:peroxisome membrane protein [Chytridium lagenaria]|nr:peroxisome membrane protein [Chytridium lagenaria]